MILDEIMKAHTEVMQRHMGLASEAMARGDAVTEHRETLEAAAHGTLFMVARAMKEDLLRGVKP